MASDVKERRETREEVRGMIPSDNALQDPMKEKERELVAIYWERFEDLRNQRDRQYKAFNDRKPTEYWDDNVERWYSYSTATQDDEDWMPNIFTPVTRNKCIAIMAKLAQNYPSVVFKKRGGEDLLRSTVMTDIYKDIEDITDAEMGMFFAMMDAAVKGTVFVFEGYSTKYFKRRTVDLESPYFTDEGGSLNIKEDMAHEDSVYSEIIPLDEAYPGDIYKTSVQDMPDFYWRQVMSYKKFKKLFQGFSGFNNIKRNGDIAEADVDFKEFMTEGLGEDQVEVIRAFDKDNDSFFIIANGRWLNPLPGQQISPLPWAHKRIPIWHSIYEPLASNFIYGKALPDKLKGEQDSINLQLNMIMAQSMLSTWRPILSSDGDDISDDFLTPGRVTPVNDTEAFKELEISPPPVTAFKVLDMLFQSTDRSSVSPNQQGQVGTGDTATEIERARESALQLLGLFVKFMLQAAKDKARLRTPNLLQFYFDTSRVAEMHGDDIAGQYAKAFRSFRREGVDRLFSKPGRTIRVIDVVASTDYIPEAALIRQEEKLQNIEKIYITPKYLRQVEFDIQVDKRSVELRTKGLIKAEEIEFQATMAKFYPNRLSERSFADLVEAFDRNPGDYPAQGQTDMLETFLGGSNGVGGPGAGTDGANRFGVGDITSQRLEPQDKQGQATRGSLASLV